MIFRVRPLLRAFSTAPPPLRSSTPAVPAAAPSSTPKLVEEATINEMLKMNGKEKAEYVVVRSTSYASYS